MHGNRAGSAGRGRSSSPRAGSGCGALTRGKVGLGGQWEPRNSPRSPRWPEAAAALGTGLRRAGGMSCPGLHDLTTTCLRRGRKRGNSAGFFSRITFARAFPGGESVTRGQHHSPFPREHHPGVTAEPPSPHPSQDAGRDTRSCSPTPKSPSPCPSSTATLVMVAVVTHRCCTPHPLHILGACGELEPFSGKLGQRKLCPGPSTHQNRLWFLHGSHPPSPSPG